MALLFCIDSKSTNEALLKDGDHLQDEIVRGLEPRTPQERELLVGVVRGIAQYGVLTPETLRAGKVDRDNWGISVSPYEPGELPPFMACIEVTLSSAVVEALPQGLLARFDQDIAETYDPETGGL